MWKALGGSDDYRLVKKRNTVFKDQIEIKAGNSVLRGVFSQLMTRALPNGLSPLILKKEREKVTCGKRLYGADKKEGKKSGKGKSSV